jgi:hypothetical protein
MTQAQTYFHAKARLKPRLERSISVLDDINLEKTEWKDVLPVLRKEAHERMDYELEQLKFLIQKLKFFNQGLPKDLINASLKHFRFTKYERNQIIMTTDTLEEEMVTDVQDKIEQNEQR